MSLTYKCVMVAVDGSNEAELAFEKAVQVAWRNQAKLLIAHVIDNRTLRFSYSTYESELYATLEQEAKQQLAKYEERAKQLGLTDVQQILEFGDPRPLLAKTIPDREGVDLILLGATGLNAVERLLIGSSSEYIMRHAHVDILIVRNRPEAD